jgi:hypothetical protein
LRKINTKRILPIRLIKALNHSMEHLLLNRVSVSRIRVQNPKM